MNLFVDLKLCYVDCGEEDCDCRKYLSNVGSALERFESRLDPLGMDSHTAVNLPSLTVITDKDVGL